ncbi:MAG: polysaccharide biosynthesis/export family protein [Bacteroidales bacterium]|nr:polysaccharide biosynthesis/export family protein [Bacteroidales bacterium]
MKTFKYLLMAVAACVLLASCGVTKKIVYFQDLEEGASALMRPEEQIRLRPKDAISIIVSTSDPDISRLFNLVYSPTRLGTSQSQLNYSQGVACYTLDAEGNIDFPILGTMQLSGMTREEAAAFIKKKLISSQMTRDAVVVIDFTNLAVSVMGEVARPGRYNITRDDYTLLDAIASAGDLTIRAKRDGVTVLRTEDGVEKKYVVDMRSVQSVVNSPVYHLQQNDIVYVEPNDVKARESTVNGNNVLSTSFWISVASLASTIALYFIR